MLAGPGSPSDLGQLNKRRIVAAVHRHNPISRADLARLSGLSKAAVSGIIQQLIEQGMLVERPNGLETERPARGSGRPGVLLEINPTYALAVGVEIADARVDAIAINLRAEVRASASRPFDNMWEPEAILATVAACVREAVDSLGADRQAVRGVGVAVPGVVKPAAGVSAFIPGLPRWRNVPVVDVLRRELALPIALDWRAFTATLAEQWYGAGKAEDNFLYINVADGVGMGIVVNGQLVRGVSSVAGDLGHVGLPGGRDDEPCICGNTGCLQTRVSVPAVVHRAQAAIARGVLTVLTAPSHTPDAPAAELRFGDLVAAARVDDPLAGRLLEEIGVTLGCTIADLLRLFNPPLVVIGGAVAEAGDVLLEPVQRTARRMARRQFEDARIVFSRLRPDPAIIGAGALMLREVLELSAGPPLE